MAFWITLIRSIFAVSLGVALLYQPDKTRPILVNFMGMYWLVSGIFSVRWGITGERSRGIALLAGIIGVLAGLGLLGRNLAANWVEEATIVTVLGVVIVLTGLMHIFGGFRTSQEQSSQRSWTSFLLGVFEVLLGTLLAVSPLDRSPVVYLAGMLWAFLGGLILMGDAIRLRRASQAQ